MAGGRSHQKNKAHKPGRHASSSRAHKQKGKQDPSGPSVVSLAKRGKEARLQAAASARNKSRDRVLEQRRQAHAPLVVQVLPLANQLDGQAIWDLLIEACNVGSDVKSLRDFDASKADGMDALPDSHPCKPTTLSVPGRNTLRVTLLPPPAASERGDPLIAVEQAKCADVVLACMPVSHESSAAGKKAGMAGHIDDDAKTALQVLRAMGLPRVIVATQGGGASLKERAAARKGAAAALASELPNDVKIAPADSIEDCVHLLRHLSDVTMEPPVWRRQRPHMLIEAATFSPAANAEELPDQEAEAGVLHVDAYIRSTGLSANQLVTIPGAGDFAIQSIASAPEAASIATRRQLPEGMQAEPAALAVPDDNREVFVRENDAAPLVDDAEQTWPTDAEMAAADAAAVPRPRVAPGTSDYQAAWIVDDEPASDDDGAAPRSAPVATPGSDVDMDLDAAETRTEAGTEADDEEHAVAEGELRQWRQCRRHDAAEDKEYPDEVELTPGMRARERYQRYRGLKSFRASPWDAREGVPHHFSRLFAFSNFARARKAAAQATQAAKAGGDSSTVPAGMHVRVVLADVPRAAADVVRGRVSAFLLGAAPPLTAFGLHKHECKLSAANMAVAPVATYTEAEPVANREQLLFVTGVRAYHGRPLLSTDEYNADKFKQERYMHVGRPCMMSVVAPIAYSPLPVLVLRQAEGGRPTLVATGTVQNPDPDRIVLKRVIFTGLPCKAQKKKAVVKCMFFNPEDVKWFKPLDLFTKYGRRGRITQPIGTHGAMKCVFDGPVQQRDDVCVALYKRVFPKWPESEDFNVALV